jgi:predicted metalloendopeptidase
MFESTQDEEQALLRVNGVISARLTLRENIADYGGTKQAFLAWQARYQSDPTNKK